MKDSPGNPIFTPEVNQRSRLVQTASSLLGLIMRRSSSEKALVLLMGSQVGWLVVVAAVAPATELSAR